MADDDAPLIIGTIIALAAAYAFAHGAGTSPASASTQSSTTSSSSAATLTSASTFPKCTHVQRLSSRDGTEYTEFPTSASGSRNCTLGRGDIGAPVTALQRGLSLCMHEPLTVDGVYGPVTARRVSHAGQVPGGSSAFYQPSAERHLNWPWYSSATTAFTGHCS